MRAGDSPTGHRTGVASLATALALALAAPRAAATAPSADTRFHFVDVAAEAGLDRVILAGRPGKDHLLDSAGNGVAWLDYDGDGQLDAYLVNGWRLAGEQVVERGRNALYRNRGDGTFTDVTDATGTGGNGQWGCGVAVADYDDDGWCDLLVTQFGSNLLLRNRGDGTFADVTGSAGVQAPTWNTGAAFFDADGDRDLDLYVAGYVEATMDEVLATRPALLWKGVAMVAVGPFGLTGAVDRFFLADGSGRFRDATEAAGLTDRARAFGFAVLATDVEADGDIDLYVANDSDPNYLYRNDGTGRFEEVGLWTGVALDGDGRAQAGMGAAVGDVNGDLVPDLVVTNFAEDATTLYRGLGGGLFEDASADCGVAAPTYMSLSWGTALVDLDRDGDQDLVITNGHIYPQVDEHPEVDHAYRQRNQLLENDGEGHFTDVTGSAGPGFAPARSSRGLAAGDYDSDGDLDLLISHLDEAPSLLRNDSPGSSWLTVVLHPRPGDGPEIGARVTVTASGRRQVRELASSGSFLSAHDPRLHFGLGAAAAIDSVEVRWPDGSRTVRRAVEPGRFLAIERGP